MEDKKRHLLMFSGGKDSTALLLGLLEKKLPLDFIVFADTGLEMSETYKFIKKINKKLLAKRGTPPYKVDIVKHKWKTFENLFYKIRPEGKRKGEIYGFPFVVGKGCWINKNLKLSPARLFKKRGDIVYLGINYDEKRRIQKENQKKEKGILKYPLIDWKWGNKECLEICKRYDLLNPLYKIFNRNGCWLCPKQPRRSLQMLWKYYPELWEKLKKLEKDCPHGFKPYFSLEEYENKLKDKSNKRIKRFV